VATVYRTEIAIRAGDGIEGTISANAGIGGAYASVIADDGGARVSAINLNQAVI